MYRARFVILGAAMSLAVLFVGPAAIANAIPIGSGADHAVFVQTDSPTGNQIVAYARDDDGALAPADTYDTGGLGGAQAGAVVDPLASQGGLTYDANDALLFAVNAGSDSVSVFGVDGAALTLHQVVSSGGTFPSSIAVRGSLAYVLNAGGAGSVQGYRVQGGKLHPIVNSARSLGLSNADVPFFTSSPGQVVFTPDGRHLVVPTKSNGTIEVFGIRPDGRLTSGVENTSAGVVPFAAAFDAAGHLVVSNAGVSSVSTYDVNDDGTLSVISAAVTNGQAATCWIAEARGFFYTGNAASGTVSTYAVSGSGQASLLEAATATGAGTIDLAATPDGSFLYVENGGAATISAFAVNADGGLVPLGTTAGPAPTNGVGFEGIVAS
ncbi:MAG TPA: beta-propeller fold lactonase family protein [Actinomycetota bacterium]